MSYAPKKCYWDACTWIAFINQEDNGRSVSCNHVLSLAESGSISLYTSAFTLAEVYKRKCDDAVKSMAEDNDESFEQFLLARANIVQVTFEVGVIARRLLRRYPKIGKPQDAVHVASCVVHDICELHTFDHRDLIALDGMLECKNSGKLTICEPPSPPFIEQLGIPYNE